MSRPLPVWLIEVWVEGELVHLADADRTARGTREHAAAVAAAVCTCERALSDREGTWETDVKLAIREKADVYQNERAPAGWVEIQRDDSLRGEESFGDMEAAHEVCDAAGVPRSCAMWFLAGSHEEDDGGAIVYPGTPDAFYPSTGDAEPDAVPKDCIAVVPAIVAWLAHLIDDEQLAEANGGVT